MKRLLCAAALASLAMTTASAATYEYTMKITSITIWDGDEMFSPLAATLPNGSVAVGDLGNGVFGHSGGGSNIGYANWGYAVTQTFTSSVAPIQHFNVGTISHVASTGTNSVSLWDSYDAHQSSDEVSFTVWHNSAEWLAVTFTDVTATHLPGTEVSDIGSFPLEHAGEFGYQMIGPDGIFYRLNGTLLAVGVDGGPMVELPPPGTLPVPEPDTWALLLGGLAVLASGRLRRRQARGASPA